MRFDEKTFILKDGREALLRLPTEADAEALLEYLRITAEETIFMMRYPEECEKRYSIEGEKEIISRANASENELKLLCEVDGEIAGMCNLSFNTYLKKRHIAKIAIGNVKKYWGLGMGTRMMAELIAMAEAREGVIQLELEFIEGNSRARALYEKLGFRVVCVHPNAFILKDGTLLNEYIMAKELKKR
ncbi:MAG: GNAT family N-acetyltransferase [Clostridia bacterium]|nr:GNAT family N-acetyltransferase [Clostridia bacterium]